MSEDLEKTTVWVGRSSSMRCFQFLALPSVFELKERLDLRLLNPRARSINFRKLGCWKSPEIHNHRYPFEWINSDSMVSWMVETQSNYEREDVKQGRKSCDGDIPRGYLRR